jgi:hypothetical protein
MGESAVGSPQLALKSRERVLQGQQSSVGSSQSALKSREGVLQGRQFSACREVSQEGVLPGPQSRQPYLGIHLKPMANG